MSFEPGNTICVDESIVWWYSLGGQLINASLPMYMALDRKPKNGCEIQNSADGGVIVELKLVKVSGEELGNSTTEDVEDMLHRTKVVKELIEPWIYSGRLVCGDLNFVSFGCVNRILSKVQKSFLSCTHVNSCQNYSLYINLHILLNILCKITLNIQESRKSIKFLKR